MTRHLPGLPRPQDASTGLVWVLGHSGMLGTALVAGLPAQGWAVRTLDRARFDARQPDWSQLPLAPGDGVVNALGLINRRLQQTAEDFVRVNSLFPRLLADHCQARGARLIHISTDCVFDGLAGPYDEADTRFATDLYGRSKREGEAPNALVLRSSIIGPERHNHYALLSWLCAQRGPVPGFVNHRWNGLTTLALTQVVGALLQPQAWAPGLAHVYGQDLSKYELLQQMQQVWQLPVQVLPTEDHQPRDTRLRSLNPAWLAGLALPPMAQQLAQLSACMDARGHWVDPT